MRNRSVFFLILVGWLWSFSSYALDSALIPFFGQSDNFKISLKGQKKLRALLREELIQQRQTNRQLQQYRSPIKIARYERQLLRERLRAEGYYGADVRSSTIDQKMVYSVDPGPLYRITKLSLKLPDGVVLDHSSLGIAEGDPLRAEAVLSAVKTVGDAVAENFCLYRVKADYNAKVLYENHSAELTLSIADSPQVVFGEISFVGLQSVDEGYLRQRLPFSSGDCFKAAAMDRGQLLLMQSNLLIRADLQTAEPVAGAVPVQVTVTERFHRTLSAGGGFQGNEGVGLSVGWEHRNLMGRAEKLTVDTLLNSHQQTVAANLTRPYFRNSNQLLTLSSTLQRLETDAFASKLITVGAELTRPLATHLRGIVGVEMAFSQVDEDNQSDTYALLSFPLSLEYDKRDDPLDPQYGWVASARVRPYRDLYNADTQFIQSTVALSGYHTFDAVAWQPTLAARAALGSITGVPRDQVPANVRFYSGGGGSVRGYAFQTLGPLTDGNPDGGLSFSEVSLEARLHWGSSWGGVVFLDGGSAFTDSAPQLDEDLFWGAGVGVRYYTSFAPIRFDIAVPLNQRPAIDDDFQIYISIGQSF